MPRGHQYHQPNAPNSDPDIADDSDLEFDLDELGPSHDQHSTFGTRTEVEGYGGNENIQLQTIHNNLIRGVGRKTRKFNDVEGEDSSQHHHALLENGGDDHQGGLNVGDSTPLLAEGDGEHVEHSITSGGLAGRLGLGGLRSRSGGYHNLGQETPSAAETGGKSASRSINIGQYPAPRFPPNAISNAKYTPWSFLPRTLYNEFSFFINLYFLIVALSQVIPPLQIGVLWTYMAPLGFVLTVTLGKEAYDDVVRRRRDAEANKELYSMLQLRGPTTRNRKQKKGQKLKAKGYHNALREDRIDAAGNEEAQIGYDMDGIDEVFVKSKDIKVGDVLKLKKNDRVPADVVILKSYTAEASAVSIGGQGNLGKAQPDLLFEQEDGADPTTSDSNIASDSQGIGASATADDGGNGETFIRTDQLDGETDWKLRLATPLTQSLAPKDFTRLTVVASKPSRNVNEFLGKLELSTKLETNMHEESGRSVDDQKATTAPLSVDNTAWANTVLASNATVLAVVIYTGAQTRQALSTSSSRSKVGLLELEINNLTKILCILTLSLSGILVGLQAYYHQLGDQAWYVSVCRYLILFSSIIPISIRVNLDIGKTVYAYFIQHDKDMPEAVVRTSTIPEDLGRIEYLLSDKTGTLTQNGSSIKLLLAYFKLIVI